MIDHFVQWVKRRPRMFRDLSCGISLQRDRHYVLGRTRAGTRPGATFGGVERSRVRPGDGTSVGFAGGGAGRMTRMRGPRRALAGALLGTPGLHDTSPLGLGWRLSAVNEKMVLEPPRGSGMQPKGVEPGRGSLGNRVMPPRPSLRTASRSRQGRSRLISSRFREASRLFFGAGIDASSWHFTDDQLTQDHYLGTPDLGLILAPKLFQNA